MKLSITIKENSRIPKYKQVVNSIIREIVNGNLKVGEKIPSINELSEGAFLSRDTVEKAYRKLKERKIIVSVKGKGFYTAKTELLSKVNVFFLVNKLSNYKMRIYNSFVNSLGVSAHTNLFIYHCDESLFLNIMEKHLGSFDHYVIMPHFKTERLQHTDASHKIIQAIDKIPVQKLTIMDNRLSKEGLFTEIYQDFENDIFNALTEALDKIKKYKRLILAFPEKSVYPYSKKILRGFKKFCIKNNLKYEVLNEIYEDVILLEKDLFVTIKESDLVNLVKRIRDEKLTIGKDIGVVSYNDTPLKDLLGITVISTDFELMGHTAADLILKNQVQKIKNPFKLIDRHSI